MAYNVLKNVTISTPGNILNKNTFSLFWDMFHHIDDINKSAMTLFEPDDVKQLQTCRHLVGADITIDLCKAYLEANKDYLETIFAVNGSDLCAAFNMSSPCSDISLLIRNKRIPFPTSEQILFGVQNNLSVLKNSGHSVWSAIFQPVFKMTTSTKSFTLCEKPSTDNLVFTNCSEIFMSCNDGTCVHDSLVCDGQPHCQHGEDEADCQHICSEHKHSCMSHCHHRDLCSCSPEYFQCLSGGCVPLQKLCDKTVHCSDASDEPPTCVYMRPQQLGCHSLPLNVSKHINTLINQNVVIQRVCLRSNNWALHDVKNVKYMMHSHQQKCSPLSLSPNIKFPCSAFYKVVSSQHYFSLDRLCVYDHDCDDKYFYHCFNGFHLLKCKHMYCVGRFKCPSSYCVSLDHICNKVCDCPHCEDESICKKLLCPGMVLIEQIGSSLKCSMKVAALTHSMNLRQVIHRRDVNITDDFPVFIHLEDVANLGQFILTPEVAVYCEIWYSNFISTDVSVFHRMISVRRLLLPHDDIKKVNDSMFAAMSQLIVLDLSHNLIKHLPQVILCALQKLQYISLHHNLIADLPARLFLSNLDLQVLLLQSNNLKPQSVIIDASFPSLYRLSSDIPRLCCSFETVKLCSPPFPLFVSCSNLITSKTLIVLGWLIGLSTPILNLFCLSLLVYKLFAPATQTPRVVMLYSINLSFAELVTSLCLLSYSVINVVFHDEFGVIADRWRHSLKCLSLESLFSVSSRLCLAFAVCISVHFTIHIPSVIPRKSSQKLTFFQIIIIWLLITSICITVQVLGQMRNIDRFNYFCFPFTTVFLPDPLILSLQSLLLILDIILLIVTFVCHGYLLVFTIRRSRNKTLQSVGKRKERLQKLGARLTVLIVSTVLTFMPVVVVQILVLSKITISPNIYFWCILVSFPINLIIDPILLIRNMLA